MIRQRPQTDSCFKTSFVYKDIKMICDEVETLLRKDI